MYKDQDKTNLKINDKHGNMLYHLSLINQERVLYIKLKTQ